MGSAAGQVLLMFTGALPGVVGAVAAIRLWQQRRILEEETVQYWWKVGMGYLIAFCVLAVVLTRNVDRDSFEIAMVWIALPAMAGMLGVWVFAERQRMMLEAFPSPRRMRQLCIDHRKELGLVTSELSNDLNGAVAALSELQLGTAMSRMLGRDVGELERSAQRIKGIIQKCNELDARYGIHLRRLKTEAENSSYDELEWSPEMERVVDELQETQHDLGRQLDRLITQAVEVRAAVNRVLANLQ